MVRLKPDVVLATAIITAVAVRKLTSTIPVGRRRGSPGLDNERGSAGALANWLPTVFGYPYQSDPVDWSAMASICLGAIIVPPIS